MAPTRYLAPHLTAIRMPPEVMPINQAVAISIEGLEFASNDAEVGVGEERWCGTTGVWLRLQLGHSLQEVASSNLLARDPP